ncbi:MAG: 50S ribosomal protein L28 [Omnitrophica WOR_2 bacterium GWA2_47_8]|nr:MAG: 50S ribosomal protein L28 [Omnitrophica WOR_2 bacterium GWA2_47_8]
MAKECEICGKTQIPGNKYKRRGAIKRTGGAGAKIVGKTLRRFLPNLQKIRIKINGTVRRGLICTTCIKSGRVTKP